MKNNIRLVTDSEAPSRLLQKHSAARLHLAGLINRELTVESNLRHLGEAAQRLQEAQQAEQQAVADLNALNAAEATAMAAWSRDGSGAEPQPNVVKRDELQAKHRAAIAKAAAARGAQATIAADQQREAVSLKQVETEIALATVPVIIEAVEPLITDYEDSNRELAAKAAKISGAAEVITQIGHSIGSTDLARPAFVALEKLSERIRIAFARPAPAISDDAWRALAAALKRDPLAELKS